MHGLETEKGKLEQRLALLFRGALSRQGLAFLAQNVSKENGHAFFVLPFESCEWWRLPVEFPLSANS
jgi:hypothetical protein